MFQSRYRRSSPAVYSRWSANSIPEPNCSVRRWANSDPRNTRRDTIDRYSSFFRKSESNKGMAKDEGGRMKDEPESNRMSLLLALGVLDARDENRDELIGFV